MKRFFSVKKITDKLKKIEDVKAIYLFGSFVTKKFSILSDLDICVITKNDILDEKKVGITTLSSDKIDISIFWELPIFIRFQVLKEGKIIFNRDSNFLHDVRIKTITEYLDFKPVIKRFAESVGIRYE